MRMSISTHWNTRDVPSSAGPKHRGIEESVDAVDGLAGQDHYKYSFGVNTRLCGYDSCGDGSIPKPPGGDEHPEAPATSM